MPAEPNRTLRHLAHRAAAGERDALSALAVNPAFRSPEALTSFVASVASEPLAVEIHDRLCDEWESWNNPDALEQAIRRERDAA